MWGENNKAQAFFSINHHPSQELDIFSVKPIYISGMVIVSTATINNVLLGHNGTVLSCSDNAILQFADTVSETAIILGMIFPLVHTENYTFMFLCR